MVCAVFRAPIKIRTESPQSPADVFSLSADASASVRMFNTVASARPARMLTWQGFGLCGKALRNCLRGKNPLQKPPQ